MERIGQWITSSGMRVTTGLANDGTFVVQHDQNLRPHVEYATALRNDDAYTRRGIQRGWMHVAHIPDVAVVKLRQIGIDVFGKASLNEIAAGLRKLGMDYLITTNKRV